MTAQTPITKPNAIGPEDQTALALLSNQLGSEFEVIINDETGDHIGSLMYIGETNDDDWEVHFMPDPYSSTGMGWVAVSDERAIVEADTLSEAIVRYRKWSSRRGSIVN